MLDNARMKALDRAIDGHAVPVETLIAQAAQARHEPAHSRHRQTSFPALLFRIVERREHWVHEHGVGHGSYVWVARVRLQLEDDDSQTHSDLGCGEARAGERAHGVVHVRDQRLELAVETRHGNSHLPQQRISHLQYQSNGHALTLAVAALSLQGA